MNMLRHIFSVKLVIVFALVAFLGAVLDHPDARALTKCPCTFIALYNASIFQAKSIGLTNKVDRCVESSGLLELDGGEQSVSPCFTIMVMVDQNFYPPCNGVCCQYIYECSGDESYDWGNSLITLSPGEAKACRAELSAIAKFSGFHRPCPTPIP
jgi:hypothetical protein